MRHLATIPSPRSRAVRPGLVRHVRRIQPVGGEGSRPFSPLIDARAAGRLLGVPHTWLLAQARAGRIPHHRLGHYVRFNAEDLARWLAETRIDPRR